MVGEQVAFRRTAVGAPIVEYARLNDRARINGGGKGTRTATSANLSTSVSALTVAAHATPHNEGAWVEIIPAGTSTFVAEQIEFGLFATIGTSTDNSGAVLDLAFGSGPEVVQIANIAVGASIGHRTIVFPFRVPAGERIAMRMQAVIANESTLIAMTLHEAGDGYLPPTSSVTYNFNAATTTATTAMTVPGTTNTESAWTQIGTTSADIYRFFPGVTNPPTGAFLTGNALIDFAYGTDGSQVVFLSDIGCLTTSAELLYVYNGNRAYPCFVPSGVALWARYRSDNLNTTARPNVIPIGFGY